MRGDLLLTAVEHMRDAHELAQSASPGRVGLGDREAVLVGKLAELVQRRETLAAGDRYAGRAVQLAIAPGVGVRQRLLKEEQIERLQRLQHRAGGREIPGRA